MVDYFGRVGVMYGESGLRRLQDAHVVVVGYGAVGSFAAEALVRTGIGHLRIVDADVYEASNVNRQLGASSLTVGRAKVAVGGERLRDISPGMDLECVRSFVGEGTMEVVTGPFGDGRCPEVVIDAIDTIESKVGLLLHLVRKGVVVWSSMGAARKTRPELICSGDISQTRVCPLAREVRKRLRLAGVERGVGCVYSTESVSPGTHTASAGTGVLGRPVLGSVVTVTGSFGLRLAAECLCGLLGEAVVGVE